MRQQILILVLAAIGAGSKTAGADVVFTDGDFADGVWHVETFSQGAGGLVSQDPQASGGFPGACLRTTTTVNAGSPSSVSTIYGLHRYGSGFDTRYEPATQGPIVSLSYRLSWRPVAVSNLGHLIQVGLKQAMVTYVAGGTYSTGDTTSIDSIESDGLIANNFVRVDGMPGHPDFSAEGAPIRFGFVTSSFSIGAGFSTTVDFDNFKVLVVQPPPPPPYCPADFNNDGGVDGADVEAFFRAWEVSDVSADTNQDGGVDGADVEAFFVPWSAGGC